MPEPAPQPVGLRHAVFLGRISEQPATSPPVRLGQGAFLVLRLLDLFAARRGQADADAFQYQWTATERYCAELVTEGPEAGHLNGLVRTAAEAYRRGEAQLLVPGLLAYALYLEDAARYEEALDVLQTLLDLAGDQLGPADAVPARLQVARVNRKMARFDTAEVAYAEAGALAQSAGDPHALLLSRMGRAEALRGRGNLAECERAYREILADAQAGGNREAEARAEHGLGVTLYHRGQPAEAAPHAWRAFELYDEQALRLRTLNDLGLMLLAVGHVEGAERALLLVVRGGGARDNTNNALIELMHCASYRRDRLAFERWRTECDSRTGEMAPNILADFYLKAGIGCARFGSFRKAEALMREGLAVASRHGLYEFEFKIERIAAGLGECEREAQEPLPAPAAPSIDTEALREVSASLAALGA